MTSYFDREEHNSIYDAAKSIATAFAKTVDGFFAFLTKPLSHLLYLVL